MTYWRRLKKWYEVGGWERLHKKLLDRLGQADRIEWSRASLDSASVPDPRGTKRPGQTQRIAANRARSAILWSTGTVYHSR
jgi:hypothetical protein